MKLDANNARQNGEIYRARIEGLKNEDIPVCEPT